MLISTGSNNVASGYRALFKNISGDNNIAIGSESMLDNTSGSNNIVIGLSADTSSSTASNELNIGNTIYGDLTTKNVGIGVENPSEKLEVNGKIKAADINFSGLTSYADQAAADADSSLEVGDVYRIGNDLKIKF